MQRLFAPWRMAYIKGEAPSEGACVLCRLPDEAMAGPEVARRNLVLELGPQAYVMLNRYPYQNGHVMVVPRRHVAGLLDLGAEEHAALAELLRQTIDRLARVLRPDGFNVGMNLGRVAGAGIADHVHWHIVPRWNGDHNFMPVLGETRVIGEHLEATYDGLLPAFAGTPGR